MLTAEPAIRELISARLVVNALLAEVAVIDLEGTIVLVNDPCRASRATTARTGC